MKAESGALEAATVRQQCKLLRMPTIGAAVHSTGRTGGARAHPSRLS